MPSAATFGKPYYNGFMSLRLLLLRLRSSRVRGRVVPVLFVTARYIRRLQANMSTAVNFEAFALWDPTAQGNNIQWHELVRVLGQASYLEYSQYY